MSTHKKIVSSIAVLLLSLLYKSGPLFGMNLQLKYSIDQQPLDMAAIKIIEKTIGYTFKDSSLLTQALTTTAANAAKNYERQEYLGDAVLEAVIVPLLLKRYPQANPGTLTAARTALVSQEPLAALCLHLGLHAFIQHVNREVALSRLCDIIESIIGAIYEDAGLPAAKDFILRFFLPMLKDTSCPTAMTTVIRNAATTLQLDIEYRWVDNQCELASTPGNGLLGNPFPRRVAEADAAQHSAAKSQKKNDPKRLARYLAEYEFIKKVLPQAYRDQLVCLAIDDTYKPLTKIPELEVVWNEKIRENYRTRLHTLMQKIENKGLNYECSEEDDGITCELNSHFFNTVRTMAPTKRDAQELAAKKGYKEIQRSIVMEKVINPHSIPALQTDDSVTAINLFCQAQNLKLPVYETYFKGKDDTAVCYSRMSVPWLMIEIKGPSRPNAKEARAAVASRVIALIKHACTDCFDPVKLYMFLQIQEALNSKQNTYGCLINVCRLAGLTAPTINSHVCEGLVTEGMKFETVITIPNNHLGAKTIVGLRTNSKAEAQENAAKKALNYLVNKLLKHELLGKD